MKDTIKMPLWGPYSKKYMGLSRIADRLSHLGARFDFIPHPTLWNSATPVPNVTVPSAYHLWECAPDYSYYAYRYELLWKDRVYADVSFSKVNDEAYLLRCAFVNNTELAQNCLLNLYASLEFPGIDYVAVNAPLQSTLINATDYTSFTYAKPRPWDTLTPDGLSKGMFRDSRFYDGCGLGDRVDHAHVEYYGFRPFGCEAGDSVAYDITAPDFSDPVLALRYRTVTAGDAVFEVNGTRVILPSSEDLSIIYLPFNAHPQFVSCGGAGVEFDFLAVIPRGETIEIQEKKRAFIPDIKTEQAGEGYRVTLDYPYEDARFTILTNNAHTRFRALHSGSLEDALINRLSNGDPTYDDLKKTFSASFQRKTSDEGFFQNTLIKSIFIEPNTTHVEYMVIARDGAPLPAKEDYEAIYLACRSAAAVPAFNAEGERYRLCTSILRATLLTNAVYPVYRRGTNVVHHAPGKRWDSFYTWDSGFIGMGLLEFSPRLCRYSLDLYLGEKENQDFPFVLHGSLVPTQFVQYLELLKRTEHKEELAYLYDYMKRYYAFLQGREGSSSFNKFDNGLLTAYDYWYSCSGMDDYPAQVAMIQNKAEAVSCPCLTTAQVIRAAKIMKMAAYSLGREEDIAMYDADIERSETALNTLAWDEESGYFGYTMYDKETPYLMRTPDGENYNKGFDGVYPLLSGSVTGARRERLLSHLKNPREMWSAAGISAVDMTASYYFDDGYWNGNVWMSHQWFVWKTMLDLGDTDFAFAIAERALEMWREETDFSYYTYECFGIKTRRGGWFHNFGGLSAPICIWANAYFKPGTVTTGLDVFTDRQAVSDDCADITFRYYGKNEQYSLIVTLSDQYHYTVTLNGKTVPYYERKKGCLEITLDGAIKGGRLQCQKES